MAIDIATQFLHCETSMELWNEAQSLVGANTKSRTIYLNSKFHNTRKREMKMDQYILNMKNLAINLSSQNHQSSTQIWGFKHWMDWMLITIWWWSNYLIKSTLVGLIYKPNYWILNVEYNSWTFSIIFQWILQQTLQLKLISEATNQWHRVIRGTLTLEEVEEEVHLTLSLW